MRDADAFRAAVPPTVLSRNGDCGKPEAVCEGDCEAERLCVCDCVGVWVLSGVEVSVFVTDWDWLLVWVCVDDGEQMVLIPVNHAPW